MINKDFPAGWYALISSHEIKKINYAYQQKAFNLNLLIWRTNTNQVHVIIDQCPHRNAKLSLGKLCNNFVTCPYHGFTFDINTTTCINAPEFKRSIDNLKIYKFITHEAYTMIWIYFGNNPNIFSVPRLEELQNKFGSNVSQFSKVWNSHITRCIENQLDFTHLPFVHKTTIGRNYVPIQSPKFINTTNSILIYANKLPQLVSSEYYFPNVWILNAGNAMKLVAFFVPIDLISTKIYIRTYSKILNYRILSTLLKPLFIFTNKLILSQDQKIVESQGNTPSNIVKYEMLMKFDGAIKLFREMWNKKLHENIS